MNDLGIAVAFERVNLMSGRSSYAETWSLYRPIESDSSVIFIIAAQL